MAARKAGLDGFDKLARRVSFYRPQTSSTSTSLATRPQQPRLIVLCSWMGAAPKHVAKYTQTYQSLFPDASILVVASAVRDTFGSAWGQQQRMRAACRAIMSVRGEVSGGSPPILLHCMSNGGGIAAAHLTGLLRREFRVTAPPYTKVIFDCMPGQGDIERGVTAVSLSLPRGFWAQLIGRWLVRLVMYTMKLVFVTLLRREEKMARLRRQLNDSFIVDRSAPRLYIYSRADAVIDHDEIHEHAQQAREQGHVRVVEEVFDKAAHCALALDNGPRYWGAIERFWNE